MGAGGMGVCHAIHALEGGAPTCYLDSMNHPRISIDPKVMGGKPCISGTRITVEVLLDHLASGESMAELLQGYPPLTEADVRAALAYAADHLRTEGLVAV
jgi:uncharacterized protein (DUF433 family)